MIKSASGRLSLLALGLLLSGSGVAARPPVADPAVVHANRSSAGGAAYREGYFGKGDHRLHYVEAGKGPLVLLYHGFPSFWYSWFDQMEALKGRYRVVAVDALGAGRSAKPASLQAYRIDRLAAQLDGLARHLAGSRRFVLVGHDWGAALAFAYAQANPHRLRGVIGMSAPPYNLFLDLVATNQEQQARSTYMQLFRKLDLRAIEAGAVPDRIWRQSYRGLVESKSITAEETELFRTALADPAAINGGMNWYRANIPPFDKITPTDRWPAANPPISVPSLLLWGDEDKTFVADFLPLMTSYAPGGRVAQLAGVAHWSSMQRPELANQAIVAFLDTLNTAGDKHR
jgi:pimeloyl-ACP methyl ester carboxylesterase